MKIKRFIKKILILLSGKKSHIKKGIKCKYKWYGNYHGSLGFNVCPTLLDDKSIVYSFGVGEDISFDESIIERHHCKVFGFDPTPKSIDWVKNQDVPKEFLLQEYGIGKNTESVNFFLPKNKEHVSGSIAAHSHLKSDEIIKVQMKSLRDIVNELGHQKIDLLKMDIEGGEYDVLESIFEPNILIDQLLIEFHEHFFDDGKEKTIQVIKSLKEKGYEIFAISDSFNEISFIRKEIISQ